ncbi:carbohydrate ABC transporter permease [Saccharospirillum salsuginis]|uniref:ABC transporter permease n=1 Tax=Saccharospirillum salsuginis TaxID=418750 RepID=A0A918KDS5_9GAMM|nr:carbohydrate ABC transporter permease [Saccharospirillum salsuginis]GGX59908.1 ABC transporter permease [Saccharospirillum salsuginis]
MTETSSNSVQTTLASGRLSDRPDARREQAAVRRRQASTLVLMYGVLISIATVLLGTFLFALLASVKEDPLEQPFRFWFAQINPVNWAGAWEQGREGSGNAWWGGFSPGGEVTFHLTYAAPVGEELAAPAIEIPRRRPGTGMAAAVYTDFAVDYASDLDIRREDGPLYEFTNKDGVTEQWQQATWHVRFRYEGEGPRIERVPFSSQAPRSQTLIDATLPPTRMERRGRVASWENVTPGVLGYVFNNYRRVFKESVDLNTGDSLFMSWFQNSLLISLGRVALTLVLATTGGYALARLKFPGQRAVFFTMLVSMMIPIQVTFISNYLVIREINLLNTPWAVIIVLVVSAQVLIMKQFFESVPREIEEAALMDGAGYWTTFYKVILPMSKPALITITIMAFQGAWNDFFWPLVLINSPPSAFALPVGLLSLRNAYGGAGDWSLILAGAFMSTVPVLILFMVFQRYIVDNPIASGSKE